MRRRGLYGRWWIWEVSFKRDNKAKTVLLGEIWDLSNHGDLDGRGEDFYGGEELLTSSRGGGGFSISSEEEGIVSSWGLDSVGESSSRTLLFVSFLCFFHGRSFAGWSSLVVSTSTLEVDAFLLVAMEVEKCQLHYQFLPSSVFMSSSVILPSYFNGGFLCGWVLPGCICLLPCQSMGISQGWASTSDTTSPQLLEKLRFGAFRVPHQTKKCLIHHIAQVERLLCHFAIKEQHVLNWDCTVITHWDDLLLNKEKPHIGFCC